MLAALYDRIGSAAFSLALRVTGDPVAAEKVVATAFAALETDRTAGPDGGDAALTQALLAVRGEAFRTRQADRRNRGHAIVRDPMSVDLPGPASGQIPSTLTEAQRERLRFALGSLLPQTREAIELMFFEGLTEAELSTRLGTSADVVRQQIHAGLSTLREATVTAS